jgi:phosphatidylinositol-3,4,5-trisphosphate 3-phosphatase/dual-specificity protein phosphatase PTEN
MDFLREKVSGNKRRFQDSDYNLDLSYITPKIIAMAFPGEGFKSLYRNRIGDVKSFLDKHHKDKYKIINISGEKYSYNVFDNKVLEYDWIDHQAPKISTLFVICKEIMEFLIKDPENIIAVNCRAGKGRTGTVICCFMIFAGLFCTPKDAFDYYSYKRFKSGEGVTQPSQKRYVYFFHEILNKKIMYPLRMKINSIFVSNFPKSKNKYYIKPHIEIYLENSNKLNFSNKKDNSSNQRKIYIFNSNEIIKITEDEFNFEVSGDFTICIYEKNDLIGRVSYNTAFMNDGGRKIDDPEGSGGLLNFRLEQIDPDNLIKNKDYDKNFVISVSDLKCFFIERFFYII